MSCPLGAFRYYLHPVRLWMLNYDCLLSQWYSIDRSTECAHTPSQSIDLTMTLDEYTIHDLDALTIAFYIYPYQNSMGNIVGLGGDETRLRMEQTHSNGYLYQSEVSVFYGGQQLTRAHVLLPEVWTFVALTFDGKNKNIKLWRNGEIASIGYTDVTSLEMNSENTIITIGGDDAALYSRIAALQLYDRVLDESEIKAARDRPLNGNVLFEELERMQGIDGQVLHTVVANSPIECSRMCGAKIYCKAFGFRKYDNVCVLYSTYVLLSTSAVSSGVDHFRKVYFV
ncbi:uncharacterized protein LOC117113327 [Anneissia japonica]|uniref:uncharacterized protein LOC117113327 n=1 Tax=Anneissia japonica TaxID=1529436 RepID=UPI0014254DA3|nr:uncharacterized protein LOC117113327 [Anneissia japonica]